MKAWPAAAALLSVFGLASAVPDPAASQQRTTVIVREQIIIRVPVRVREVAPASASASLIRWREGRGPNCLNASDIVGATLLSENSVDLVLRDNRRVRARLSSRCPALDYYYGFYVRPTADGKICAERDTIRSRMGGQCGIERFRSLTAVRRD